MFQLKSFIQENLPVAEIKNFTPTLKSDNDKTALTVRQLTNHLVNLKIDILDNRNITGKHLKLASAIFYQIFIFHQMIAL